MRGRWASNVFLALPTIAVSIKNNASVFANAHCSPCQPYPRLPLIQMTSSKMPRISTRHKRRRWTSREYSTTVFSKRSLPYFVCYKRQCSQDFIWPVEQLMTSSNLEHVSTDTRNQAEETDRATSQLTRNCNGGCRGLLFEDPQFDFITAGMVVAIGYRPWQKGHQLWRHACGFSDATSMTMSRYLRTLIRCC